METVIENKEYKVTFNGSKTYSVMQYDDCIFASSSKNKALNYYKKTLLCAGL